MFALLIQTFKPLGIPYLSLIQCLLVLGPVTAEYIAALDDGEIAIRTSNARTMFDFFIIAAVGIS
jgi:hypothetical protein